MCVDAERWVGATSLYTLRDEGCKRNKTGRVVVILAWQLRRTPFPFRWGTRKIKERENKRVERKDQSYSRG